MHLFNTGVLRQFRLKRVADYEITVAGNVQRKRKDYRRKILSTEAC